MLEVKKNLILIDNVDINDILYKWQLRLGYIPQDIYLLNSSIKENISFGENQEKIDENKIIDIIKVLNFDKFINDSEFSLDETDVLEIDEATEKRLPTTM